MDHLPNDVQEFIFYQTFENIRLNYFPEFRIVYIGYNGVRMSFKFLSLLPNSKVFNLERRSR